MGRTLINGGGIFPDLEIENDTLKTMERELIASANEARVLLGLRLAEFGFEVATTLLEEGEKPSLPEGQFERFLAQLEEEGLPGELLSDEDVRSYLHWQARINIAQRMDDVGSEADFRKERDRVLAEAIQLLMTSDGQTGLFQKLDERASGVGNQGAES
jgi:hypothetical protein